MFCNRQIQQLIRFELICFWCISLILKKKNCAISTAVTKYIVDSIRFIKQTYSRVFFSLIMLQKLINNLIKFFFIHNTLDFSILYCTMSFSCIKLISSLYKYTKIKWFLHICTLTSLESIYKNVKKIVYTYYN